MKNKTLAAFAIAGFIILQMPIVALAADHGNADLTTSLEVNGTEETNIGSIEVSSGNALTVISGGKAEVNRSVSGNIGVWTDGSGTEVTIGEDVIGRENGVYARNYAEVHVDGNVKSEESTGGVSVGTVSVQNSSVYVKGDVYNQFGDGIRVEKCGYTEVKNVTGKTEGITVFSNGRAKVTGTVMVTGDASAQTSHGGVVGIYADNGTVVTEGSVISNYNGIIARAGATVTAGSVDAQNTGICIYSTGTKVIIEGSVYGGETALSVDYVKNASNVTVYQLTTSETGKLIRVSDDETVDDKDNKALASINYIIKDVSANKIGSFTLSSASGKTGKATGIDGTPYETAKEDDGSTNDIIIKVAEVDGYIFKSFGGDSAAYVKSDGEGSYILIVPRGGGVSLDLVYEAIVGPTPVPKVSGGSSYSTTETVMIGSAAAPVSNGSWTEISGMFRYMVDGKPIKNAVVWITYTAADGKQYSGCFCFDKYGNMRTGWRDINGRQYYFNEIYGATRGMMLVNTTTPDGKTVGADGARIQ